MLRSELASDKALRLFSLAFALATLPGRLRLLPGHWP